MTTHLTTEMLAGLASTQTDANQLAQTIDRLSDDLLNTDIAAFEEAAFAAESGTVGDPRDNVVGLGIGRSRETGGLVARVLLRDAMEVDALESAADLGGTANGLPIEYETVGEIVAQHKTRHAPIPAGVSVGNATRFHAGTLGCWVEFNGRTCVLSNNHVLALAGSSPPAASITQQGRLDGGTVPADVFARLTRAIPISFTTANAVDAAVAEIDGTRAPERRVFRGAAALEALVSPHVAPSIGQAVQKSGRRTGHTKGVVDLVGVSVRVNFSGRGLALFDNQFQIIGTSGKFSDKGDSGSLITLDPSNQPVGLLFAAGMVEGVAYTYANDIDVVLKAFPASIMY